MFLLNYFLLSNNHCCYIHTSVPVFICLYKMNDNFGTWNENPSPHLFIEIRGRMYYKLLMTSFEFPLFNNEPPRPTGHPSWGELDVETTESLIFIRILPWFSVGTQCLSKTLRTTDYCLNLAKNKIIYTMLLRVLQ